MYNKLKLYSTNKIEGKCILFIQNGGGEDKWKRENESGGYSYRGENCK